MAEKIQMWRELGPQIVPGSPLDPEEFIETLIETTGQSEGALVGVLAEVDTIIVRALRSGRRVKLPNGLRFRPIGKKDGSIRTKIDYGVRMNRRVNNNPRAEWKNSKNIDISEDEMIAQWNELHPDDPIT